MKRETECNDSFKRELGSAKRCENFRPILFGTLFRDERGTVVGSGRSERPCETFTTTSEKIRKRR